MGRLFHRYKILLPLFLFLPLPTMAEERALTPLTYHAAYRVAWGGVTLGRIHIEAAEGEGKYHMAILTKTSGLAALVTKDRSLNLVEGVVDAAGHYLPASYESKPIDDEKRVRTRITYDAAGHIASRSREPEDDPAWRPPVPVADANMAIDPITAAFVLRRALFAAIAKGEHQISTRTYDGARLATMTLTRQPAVSAEIAGKKQALVDVTIARAPIAGYTPKELKKFQAGDPVIHLYLTDDARFLPVKASADTGLGSLSMTMED